MESPPAKLSAPETPAEPTTARAEKPAVGHRLWPWLVAVLVALTFLTFPPAPAEIDMNADPSLCMVLHYAHEHHWQFGQDIAYTYGPLGYLLFFYFWPKGIVVRMLVDVALCYSIAAGLCLVAWRLRPWWRWPLIATFVFVAANLEPRIEMILDTGLLCWGLLCLLEKGSQLKVSAWVLTALAAFAALAKTSYLLIGALTVIFVAATLVVRRCRALGLGILGGFAVLWLLGWVGCSQSLGLLGSYLGNALAVIHGYNQALGWEGLPIIQWSGFATGSLMLGLIVLRSSTTAQVQLHELLPGAEDCGGESAGTPSPRGVVSQWSNFGYRLLLCLWLLLLAYTDWKHGFVREDFFHPAFALGFAPVLALALEVLPCRSSAARWGARGLAIACSLVALTALQTLFLPGWRATLPQPLRTGAYNFDCLLRPGQYIRNMNRQYDKLRADAQLPEFRRIIGPAPVDFFGYNQAYVLFNDLNYRTAPVFQSYLACNDRLNRLNEQFYLSPAAPDYVMLTLAAVDRKFPPLEDSRVLRHLMFNYELAGTEQRFLLLKKKTAAAPRLTLLREGSVAPSQPIDLLTEAATNLWLEIHIEPTLAGRVREFLYRAPTVRLAVWRQPGKDLLDRHRAPPASLAAGFIASPLLTKTRDLQGVLEGKPAVRPGAFSVELLPGEERWWQPVLRYRVYSMDKPPGSRNQN